MFHVSVPSTPASSTKKTDTDSVRYAKTTTPGTGRDEPRPVQQALEHPPHHDRGTESS